MQHYVNAASASFIVAWFFLCVKAFRCGASWPAGRPAKRGGSAASGDTWEKSESQKP